MSHRAPRVVVVTRPTPWSLALARYGTEGQARFVLGGRGQDVAVLRRDHDAMHAVLHGVLAAIPLAWRQTRVDRSELDRFLFEPDDLVVVVGQDGLVANVARYLSGQPVIGVDGAPGRNAGVLVPHDVAAARRLIPLVGEGADVPIAWRTLVEARLEDGTRLLGLNEIFVGHRSHQSARYELAADGTEAQPQSSSGVVVATGTGATGWAASIHRQRPCEFGLPAATEPRLAWFVREAWPGPGLDATRVHGQVGPGQSLRITSTMDAGGCLFSDGIEADALGFDRGRVATIGLADERLALVTG